MQRWEEVIDEVTALSIVDILIDKAREKSLSWTLCSTPAGCEKWIDGLYYHKGRFYLFYNDHKDNTTSVNIQWKGELKSEIESNDQRYEEGK